MKGSGWMQLSWNLYPAAVQLSWTNDAAQTKTFFVYHKSCHTKSFYLANDSLRSGFPLNDVTQVCDFLGFQPTFILDVFFQPVVCGTEAILARTVDPVLLKGQ